MKIHYLLIAFYFCLFGHPAWTKDTDFYQLKVEPAQDVPRLFIANGQYVSILLISHTKGDSDKVDAFPEPPLIVRSQRTKSTCAISEGGIWERASIYLSTDERYLLASEFSGSGSDLVIYNTGNCQTVKRLNNLDRRWRIHQGKLELGEKCTEDGYCSLYYPLDLSELNASSKKDK